MEALSSNKELADQLTAASNPDEATEIAKAAGYTITSQELLEAYKTKMAAMSSDELANVAGGKGGDKYNTEPQGGADHAILADGNDANVAG